MQITLISQVDAAKLVGLSVYQLRKLGEMGEIVYFKRSNGSKGWWFDSKDLINLSFSPKNLIEDIIQTRLWNTAEVATFLGLSKVAIQRKVQRKTIPFRKIDGRLVFFPNEIKEWVNGANEEQSKTVDLWDIQEVAKFLEISVDAVKMKVWRKTIPHVKIGGKLYFSPEEIREWLEKKVSDSISKYIR